MHYEYNGKYFLGFREITRMEFDNLVHLLKAKANDKQGSNDYEKGYVRPKPILSMADAVQGK